MTLQEFNNELEPIRRGGVKVSEINIQNAIQRAIQKIVLKTTPINLITRDTTIPLIKALEIDSQLIKSSGYYVREAQNGDDIDLEPRLLSALLYLVAYEFAPAKEQTRLLQQAQDEVNSHKWYLYDLASVEGFDINKLIEPYVIRDTINDKVYKFDDDFVNALDSYLYGNSVENTRDKKYIDMYIAYTNEQNTLSAMQALDKALYVLAMG